EVAHEALFTSWERLKKWIEGGRQIIFARNRLTDDAQRWHRLKQVNGALAEDELLSGSRLGQALEMHARGDFSTIFGGLPDTEAQFLDASAAFRHRRAARQRRWIAATWVFTCLAGGAALFILAQNRALTKAVTNAHVAGSNAVAASQRAI